MGRIQDYDDVMEEERRREEAYDSAAAFLEKQKKIGKEFRRIKKQFSQIEPKKKELVYAVMEDAAFLRVTMEELRERINREGTTCEYKNGENQYGTKQSPDAQLYLQMSQKQSAAMKILLSCMPPTEKPEPKTDGFDKFMRERDE